MAREAKGQGLTLNTYITSCVQRDRVLRGGRNDTIRLEGMEAELSRLRSGLESHGASLERILAILVERSEPEVDLEHARQSMTGILFNPAYRDEVKLLVTKEALAAFVRRKAPHLGRHLATTPDRPATLLDEILFELEAAQMVSITPDGKITWGLKAWGA